ncbi:MAG: SLC13 family permease [Bryobacteraceae bacterium]
MTATLIFIATYFVIAAGRLPLLRIDRTGAAIIGATAMIGFNILTVEEAYRAVNFATLILLFGMMIVVANLRLSGFFSAVARRVVRYAHLQYGGRGRTWRIRGEDGSRWRWRRRWPAILRFSDRWRIRSSPSAHNRKCESGFGSTRRSARRSP